MFFLKFREKSEFSYAIAVCTEPNLIGFCIGYDGIVI